MTTATVPELARPRVLAAAEHLLLRTGVAGVVPTPLDAVAATAGIREVLDISELPAPMLARKPSFLRRVVGALVYREQVAFIDYSQAETRSRFTEAHEIAHRALPWHQASHELFFDDKHTLDPATERELEAEANLMGAHLLFQGQRYHQQAAEYELTLATPVLLASQYATSVHASIRYYVEHHPEPVALAIAGRLPGADGAVPVWTTVASPSFTTTHSDFARWFPTKRLEVGAQTTRPLGQLARQALRGEDLPTVDLQRRNEHLPHRYHAEAFFNQHCLFLLVTPHNRLRLGRRVRLAV